MAMNIKSAIKKNGLNILLLAMFFFLLFNPNAKAWVLNKLLYMGIYNVDTKKTNTEAEAPNLVFMSQTGHVISTKQLTGKTVFINFWATWCPPCLAEMPTINALHEKIKLDTGIVFIIVDIDRDFSRSTAFMRSKNFNLPVFMAEGNVPPEIMSGTVPTTIIISSRGKLSNKIEGMSNYNTASMVEYLKSLQ